MGTELKFTKAQINKERKDKSINVTLIDELHVIEGPLLGLEKRIKEAVKSNWRFTSQRWIDGSKFKLSELSIEEDIEYTDYYSNHSVKVYKVTAAKVVLEEDSEVIARLTKNTKTKIKRDNKKAIQEKREKSLLKTLKEKYKEEV